MNPTKYQQIVSRDEVPKVILKQLGALVLDESYKHSHISFTMYKGRIVAVGRNSYSKTHPEMERLSVATGATKNRRYLHSELAALIRSKQKIDSIWVFRLGRSKQWLLSAPCPICEIAITEAGVNCYHS